MHSTVSRHSKGERRGSMRGDAVASNPVLSGAASRQVGLLRSQGHAVGPDITLGTHGVGRKKTGPEAHRRVARLGWCRVLEAYRGANRKRAGVGTGHRMPATARAHRTLTVNESERPQEHDSGQPEGASAQPGWRAHGITSSCGWRRWLLIHISDLPFPQRPFGRSHYQAIWAHAHGGPAHTSGKSHRLPWTTRLPTCSQSPRATPSLGGLAFCAGFSLCRGTGVR